MLKISASKTVDRNSNTVQVRAIRHKLISEEDAHADERRRLPGVPARPTVRACSSTARRSRAWPTSRCWRPASTPSASPTISPIKPEHPAVMTARQGDIGQDRQPDAPHQRDLDGPALQARGGPAGLPGVGLRPALSHPRRPQRRSSRRRSAPTTSTAPTITQRFLDLSARGAGRGPDPRRRHDRRQGRPLEAAGRSRPTPTSMSTSRSAGRTASSSAAPRPSSPARPTCTSSS